MEVMNLDENNINKKPIVEDLDGLSKDELKRNAINEFSIDEDKLNNEIEKEPVYSKETADAMANMGSFAERFENTLRGKQLVKSNKNEEKYVQKGKALAGENFIRITTSLLNAFGNHAMLLSGKDEKDFFIQFEGVYFKVSDLIMNRESNIEASSIPSIINDFKYTFWNIGDILLKTKPNMGKYFDHLDSFNKDIDTKTDNILGDR